MKKVTNINLGGLPYIIDEDAYDYLNHYFNSLKRHFSASEGCDEIIYDIELRMSELFQEQLKSKQIITMHELTGVIEIMGKPEDFGAEALDHEEHYSTSSSNNGSKSFSERLHRTGRKLYRDGESKMLGGVASGLSAYLGIDDPLWLRILFAISIFTFGVGFVPYIILWIILPVAKTSADKLAMRGEPINIDNIAKTIETEITDLSERINKYSGKKKVDSQKLSAGINQVFVTASNIVLTLIRTVINIAKPVISIGVGSALGGLILLIVAIIIGSTIGHSFYQFFVPKGPIFTVLTPIAITLLFLIPIAAIILNLAKWFFPHKSKTYGMWMGGAWTACFIIVFSAGVKTLKSYEASYKESSSYDLSFLGEKKLNIKFDGNHGEGLFQFDNLRLNGEELQMDIGHIKLKPSDDGKLKLVEEVSARGYNQIEAKAKATKIMHDFKFENGNLTFPLYKNYNLAQGYRGEISRYTLYVPSDMKITLPEKDKWKIWYDSNEITNEMLTSK